MNRKPEHSTVRDNRNIITTENEGRGGLELIAILLSFILVIVTFPISLFFCLITVTEYQRVVLFRLGRLRKGGARGPGYVFVLPCVDDWVKVDMRTNSFEVPPQEILTQDSVTIKVDAVVFYRLHEPLKVVIQVANARESTEFLAQTTLRNVAGTKNLMDLITHKKEISESIAKILDAATDVWGVQVERVELKDIRIPITLQRTLAAEAEAVREAKAKLIAAEGELSASRALKAASDIMAKNMNTLQLRYLQTLSNISAENNSTVVFPFPIELMKIADTSKGKQCVC